jgi:hypothetical protein
MRKLGMTVSLAALATIGACSRGNDVRPDDALKNDLALAAQAQPYQAQQFVSPTEQQYGANGAPLQNKAGTTRAPAMRAPAPVYRAPARRTASRSSGSSRSGGYNYPAAQPAPVKHTGRDAAIGAGAGAILGAATSRDKLKGGLIGAAAGGILGAVIGNNVDVQHP